MTDERHDWWESDQEVAPRPRPSWRDERDENEWLNDFDFDDVVAAEDADRIGGLWDRWGSRDGSATVRAVAAQRVVQGFVNTFATGDRPYAVVFDEAVKTAGTDFRARKVVVSHKPLFDATLSADEASTILTAMAVHEASHVRYGRKTHAAVVNRYATGPDLAAALALSNTLDDVRIERRFAEDYPGYAGVFAPALDYVAKGSMDGGALVDPSRLDPLGRVTAAVRYTDYVEWTPETIADRDWWLDWAARGSSKDTAPWRLAAIAEGIAHLAETAEPEPKSEPKPKPKADDQSGSNETSSGQDGESTGAPAPADDEDYGDKDGSGDGGFPAENVDDDAAEAERIQKLVETAATGQDAADDGADQVFPTCVTAGIDQTAEGNGLTPTLSAERIQRLVAAGQALTDPDEKGYTGEVYWGPRGISRGREDVARSAGASAAIRAAFARSRTGHDAADHGLRSGRLDNRSLHRIASNDFRLFSRRIATSEGRYRVWLFVDCSESMRGSPVKHAAEVALALASATRHLPNVALDVWGWTSPFRRIGDTKTVFGAVRVFADGEPLSNIGYLPGVPTGWTPDAEAVRWAAKAIKDVCRPGEQPVLIVASDGQGSMATSEPMIEDIRRTGVEVLSVALGRLSEDFQRSHYGHNGYVPWQGSIAKTAKPLGRIIARLAAGRGAR